MRIHRRALALCLVVPALFVAACGSDDDNGGGGNSDEDQITEIINSVAADPLVICEHLSDDDLQSLFNGGAEDCRKAGEEAGAEAGDGEVEIHSVEVDGDTAVAKFKDNEGEQTVKFNRSGDTWFVDSESLQ